tara:strand:+ start:728 stop:925 length:198 start_codon:yes stop_codon:yes gene_type:complete
MKFIFKESKIYYRKFDLFQNSWIDLFLDQTEEEIIKSMHPKLENKLERVETLDNGKKTFTLIWES